MKYRTLAFAILTAVCGTQLVRAQGSFGELTEEETKKVESELGMDRNEILRVEKEHPLPKQFGQADRLASEALAKAASSVFEDNLPDFGSSRLRNVRAVLTQPWNSFNRTYYICGDINAKTRFGGYGGWEAFIVERSHGEIQIHLAKSIAGSLLIPTMCARNSDFRTLEDRNGNYIALIKPHSAGN